MGSPESGGPFLDEHISGYARGAPLFGTGHMAAEHKSSAPNIWGLGDAHANCIKAAVMEVLGTARHQFHLDAAVGFRAADFQRFTASDK